MRKSVGVKNFLGKNGNVYLFGLLALAAQSANAVTGLKGQLGGLICAVSGNSSITMFAGAAALISFLVLFTLGEGKDHLSTILKIAVGISGLIFLPSVINVFSTTLLTSCTGSGSGTF